MAETDGPFLDPAGIQLPTARTVRTRLQALLRLSSQAANWGSDIWVANTTYDPDGPMGSRLQRSHRQ